MANSGIKPFGTELILDLKDCKALPCNRVFLHLFFRDLCDLLDMVRENTFYWDYQNEPEEYENAPDHLKGISAVQFIRTSNITVHTLDALGTVYINIFSCKAFDTVSAMHFCAERFQGICHRDVVLKRG